MISSLSWATYEKLILEHKNSHNEFDLLWIPEWSVFRVRHHFFIHLIELKIETHIWEKSTTIDVIILLTNTK